jgi:hypothetical protein
MLAQSLNFIISEEICLYLNAYIKENPRKVGEIGLT